MWGANRVLSDVQPRSIIEASYAFHFEGLSNFSLSVEVLVHHTEDFLRHTSET